MNAKLTSGANQPRVVAPICNGANVGLLVSNLVDDELPLRKVNRGYAFIAVKRVYSVGGESMAGGITVVTRKELERLECAIWGRPSEAICDAMGTVLIDEFR